MGTCEEFVTNIIDSGMMSPERVQEVVQAIPAERRPRDDKTLADYFTSQGVLTQYQAYAIRGRDFRRLAIGQYDILELIGEGGMGAVYRARHRRMKRLVAIKMISRKSERPEKLARRFEREVELLSRLQHPNIVIAHDADECPDGPYLVLEYVNGSDLSSIVARDGPMNVADAFECILQAARGLDYAHGQGVVHRDVKPANLLRDGKTGCIKIADLGLARARQEVQLEGVAGSTITDVGSIVGTVAFMAPEQANNVRLIDYRSDIYSLGCTLHYLLTSRPPFSGLSTMETILLHRDGLIPSLREARDDVPESLDRVSRTMLAKSPADRYPSMAAVIEALEGCRVDVAATEDARRRAGSPNQLRQLAPVELHPDAPASDALGVIPDAPASDALGVMLAEPSRAQSVLIRGLLKALGIERVRHVTTGAEALAALGEEAVDVVISSLYLPDMMGTELAEQIRAEKGPEDVGLVVISSSAELRGLEQAAQSHGIGILTKPFDEDQLSWAIAAAALELARRPR